MNISKSLYACICLQRISIGITMKVAQVHLHLMVKIEGETYYRSEDAFEFEESDRSKNEQSISHNNTSYSFM